MTQFVVPADELYVSFGGTSLTVASKSFNITHSQTQYDTSAFEDGYESTGPGKKKIEASMDVFVLEFANGGAAQLPLLAIGNEQQLLWGREGNGAGKPKGGFLARVADASQKFATNDAAMYSIKFTMAGTDLLFDETSAVW